MMLLVAECRRRGLTVEASAMLDYESIKAMAKRIDRPVKDLLALSPVNDPFYAGVGHTGKAAEWFAEHLA